MVTPSVASVPPFLRFRYGVDLTEGGLLHASTDTTRDTRRDTRRGTTKQTQGQGITQGEVDDYNAAAAAKRKSIQLEFDLEKEVPHVDKR